MVMNGNDSEQGSFDMMVFQPDKTLLKGLKNFSQTTFEEAKNVIQNRMPSKILNLTELLRVKLPVQFEYPQLIDIGKEWLRVIFES